MSRHTLLGIVVIGVASSLVWGDGKEPPQQVSVMEIGRSVTLMGQLGKPLGHSMEISGRWFNPDVEFERVNKDNSARFRIESVDGKKLKEPIDYSIWQFRYMQTIDDERWEIKDLDRDSKLPGQVWTMIAYETGLFTLDSRSEKDSPFPQVGMPYYYKPFTSELGACVRTINGQEVQGPLKERVPTKSAK